VNFLQLYTQAGNASLVNDVPLAKQAVNDAIEEITAECAFNMTESALLTLTGGTYQYSFTTLIAAQPLKVHYIKYFPSGTNPISSVLGPVTLEQLLELQDNSGAVWGAGCFCVPDYDKLWFYPTPGAGDQCRLYYSAVVTDLVADADIPTVIQPRMHYLITYIAARNLAIVNNAAMVQELEPLAQLAIAKLRTDKNLYGSRRPMSARVGLPDVRVVSDRSQYWSGDH
jgi:hypothetical protein